MNEAEAKLSGLWRVERGWCCGNLVTIKAFVKTGSRVIPAGLARILRILRRGGRDFIHDCCSAYAHMGSPFVTST